MQEATLRELNRGMEASGADKRMAKWWRICSVSIQVLRERLQPVIYENSEREEQRAAVTENEKDKILSLRGRNNENGRH